MVLCRHKRAPREFTIYGYLSLLYMKLLNLAGSIFFSNIMRDKISSQGSRRLSNAKRRCFIPQIWHPPLLYLDASGLKMAWSGSGHHGHVKNSSTPA